MHQIDLKVNALMELTNDFLFIQSYSHTDKDMYKIKNYYTEFGEDIIVLSAVDDGIELALDLAIAELTKRKNKFYGTIV